MPELLLSGQDLGKAFGAAPLFEGLSFGIFEGDHVGLMGPNGSGKTTLLKVLAGLEPPSSGTRAARKRLRLGYVEQDPTFPAGASVDSVLREACRDAVADEHEAEGRIAVAMGKAGFSDAAQRVATLSGGWKKRLAVARELAREPNLLLLDEPTNHLDLEGILWLEKLLAGASFAFVLVSHDRYFLENVTNRVVELNAAYADGYLSVNGSYSDFLVRREEYLEAQAAREQALASRVRREVEWLKRKAKARTTKAKGRIDQADRMMADLVDLKSRNAAGTGPQVQIDFAATDRRTRKLLTAKGVAKSLGGRALFRDLNLVLSPGMKFGLLGPNGSGKTTLIRL